MRKWMFAAAMAAAAALGAEAKINGFVKTWATLGEDNGHAVRQAGLLLKSARLKISAEPAEGVKAVVVPELAGGIQLLDAYVLWEALPGLLSLEAGQFKYPFGQDRMESPASLLRSDYSPITKALFPRNAWDDGFMASLGAAGFKADLAAFEGLGPNLAAPAGNATGNRDMQEFSGSVEYAVSAGIAVGASGYSGLNALTALTVTALSDFVTGAHARARFADFELRAEWINQHWGRYGLNLLPSYKLSEGLTVLAYYDRIDDPLSQSAGKTGIGAGVAWQLNPAIRLNVEGGGGSVGPSESPENFNAVLQVLAKY